MEDTKKRQNDKESMINSEFKKQRVDKMTVIANAVTMRCRQRYYKQMFAF